jgi:hypothetical protein
MPWFDTKISRRKFLKLAGSGIAIVVVGGTVWRAFSNGVFSSGHGPAYEPWKDWKTETEEGAGPLSLVASAILAANAHNTQPWLFVVNPNKIDLFADTKRNIGTIDPYLREMYEGLGCALENLVLAAEAKGYSYNLKLMPNPTSKTHVATISLIQRATSEESATQLLLLILLFRIRYHHTMQYLTAIQIVDHMIRIDL